MLESNSVLKKTILIVEDEAVIAMNEAEVLKRHGFSVISVYNAEKAISVSGTKKIDIILMDIDLGRGKMDGTEAAEIILRNKDIPIIFLSSHTEPEVVEKTESISSFGYVVKNCGETILVTSIKMAFRLFNAKKREQEKEKQLEDSNRRLKESEEKYRALYTNAPLPYQSLGDDGALVDVNPAWLRTLGYEREEVIGRNFASFLHPDWKSHFEKNFPAFKKRGYVHDVRFKIRHKNGNYRDISFEGCIGYNPDGSFRQTYCVFKDITENAVPEHAHIAESQE